MQLSAKFPELKEAQAELELLLVDAPGVVGGSLGVPLVPEKKCWFQPTQINRSPFIKGFNNASCV